MSAPEDFMAHEINRAVSEADSPRGMSTHDGKARVDAAILRRLMAERDALRAELASIGDLDKRHAIVRDSGLAEWADWAQNRARYAAIVKVEGKE